MKVKLLNPMFYPLGTTEIAKAGETVDVPEEMADDWIKRELATPVTPAPTPVLNPPPSRGRR